MPQETTGVVTATTLNVRPEPNTNRPAIGKLSRGTAITILERSGAWYRIKNGTVEGFVHGDFIKVSEPAPVTGFLHERPELKQVPLVPSAADRITLPSRSSPAQRLVAGVWNAYGGLLKVVGDILNVDDAAAVAIIGVESSGQGMGPDGRMVIRFENHIFWKEWGSRNASTFNAHFQFNQSKRWTGHTFRAGTSGSWKTFHGRQGDEWTVFEFARGLNETAAMRSISMGLPQIMGFNFASIGYDSVQEMFNAFQGDIRYQILGLFDFIKGPGTTSPMLSALQRKRYEDFASRYNGPGQAAVYGGRIASQVDAFESLR